MLYTKFLVKLAISLLFIVLLNFQAFSQTEKSALTFDDIRLWRTHTVTLSDDGMWYTVRYSLFDELDSEVDTLIEKEVEAFYGEENQTDVLYIYHANEGLKFEIPFGKEATFSSSSEWIAYQIMPEEEEEQKVSIELKHLASGFTVQYESEASFEFLEESDFFVTKDKNSFLMYDLNEREEHFIGHIDEYILDNKTNNIAYTISTDDKRGNGIYLYDPNKRTTRALKTGSWNFSNLSWNTDRTALAAYAYKTNEEDLDTSTLSILLVNGIDEQINISEYPMVEMEGLQDDMLLATKTDKSSNNIVWSNDGKRLFIKIKANQNEEQVEADSMKNNSSVQVWHWKDKKLLSERILDSEQNSELSFHAIFNIDKNEVVQLTTNENQELIYSEGADDWGIIRDYSNYISDWNISKSDLYLTSLETGESKLILEGLAGSWYSKGFEISPDGKAMVYWDGSHYVYYDFLTNEENNLTKLLPVSFVNKNYDKFGYSPDYGFVGWLKGDAILVENEFDLWSLPVSSNDTAANLTKSISTQDSVRFRVEDLSFEDEVEIEDRYIDLSDTLILNAYNTQNKHAGFFSISDKGSKEIRFQASTFSRPYRGQSLIRSKKSNRIIYHVGDYQNYPEAYLSDLEFSSSQRISYTNPQQSKYKWGKRILINYKNDDGVPLQGILSIPETYKEGNKLPMIVHSYEKMSYNMYRYAIPYLNGAVVPEMLFVSNDYLFLRPDIHFNVGTPHSDMHECIDAAIERVIDLGYVDPERIAYEGFSFGGHCGMYISTQENKFAAIAAGAGVSNLVQGFNIDIVRDGSNEQDYYMTGQGRLGTDPTSDTEMYISESPVFNANTMNTPLLLFHGTSDKVVQWEHSFGFYSILRYLKKPVVFLSYRGEGHGLRKEENRLDIQMRLKDYFDHYLKGTEAKDWMLDEIPYVPSDSDEQKDEKTGIPKWK